MKKVKTKTITIEEIFEYSEIIPTDLLVTPTKTIDKVVQKNMCHSLRAKRVAEGWEYTNPLGFAFILEELYDCFTVEKNRYYANSSDLLPKKKLWIGVFAA